MATVASPVTPNNRKWKDKFSRRRNSKGTGLQVETPKEADNGMGRSLSATRNSRKKGGGSLMRKLFSNKDLGSESVPPLNHTDSSSPSSPQSPASVASVESDLENKGNALEWSGSMIMEDKKRRDLIYQKQQIKERDGFCRRVDKYDGSVIVVDKKPTYEIGNYLGGGVAGVVYEGHRLRPLNEYPIRGGVDNKSAKAKSGSDVVDEPQAGCFCAPVDFITTEDDNNDSIELQAGPTSNVLEKTGVTHENVDLAIEATVDHDKHGVMVDTQDAPSRSHHFTRAASMQNQKERLTEEAVAVKILNPVGYRILQADGLKGAVVVKRGEKMDSEVKKGTRPMEERHVWWLVNPNSRNLRTLQRYNGKDEKGAIQVDRGSAEKGLRLSLIAAHKDPVTNELRELTLTRCIEIWGHLPFTVTDLEFEDTMLAIERVNAGQAPLDPPTFEDQPPSRVGTDSSSSFRQSDEEKKLEEIPLQKNRTGLLRAAYTERATVHCKELDAFIAIPAVPSKYLRWLRQRRAATKEIRNMMLIGRHKNVLHLFEVLEYIQESKSTMFLILEIVKGGELFDLISSSAGKNSSKEANEESERMMRKYFFELSSGIQYCHKSGIAHRDLKPENLLVHNGVDGESTLKIADFGLSASFGEAINPLSNGGSSPDPLTSEQTPSSPAAEALGNFFQTGVSALSFLTCGAMEGLCSASGYDAGPAPLRRMTSVVGSPHYVAPEIISQSDDKRKKSSLGYDGSKADVWSAGVILYAMLFRSLPFGEDLLRCPRYQSYKKWYDQIREMGGRRSSSEAALNPNISEAEAREYLGPHWFFPSTSTLESRDLIVAMLNPLPSDRLSIDQVLRHSWLASERNQ